MAVNVLIKRATIFHALRRSLEITQNSTLYSTLLIQNPKSSCKNSTRNAAVIMLTLNSHPRAVKTLLHFFPRCTITVRAPPVPLPSSLPNSSPQKIFTRGTWLALTRDIQSRKSSTIPSSLYPLLLPGINMMSRTTPPLEILSSLSLFLSLSLRLSPSFKAIYY